MHGQNDTVSTKRFVAVLFILVIADVWKQSLGEWLSHAAYVWRSGGSRGGGEQEWKEDVRLLPSMAFFLCVFQDKMPDSKLSVPCSSVSSSLKTR